MQKKHLIVLSAAAMVLLTTSCSKLKPLSADNFNVVPNPLETQQGTVPATINGMFPEKYMKKKAVVTITPELRYADGQVAQGPAVRFQGEKVMGNDQIISYLVGGRYTMKSNFAYLNCNKADLYLKFFARIGAKPMYIPEVKVAEGIVATSELYKNTLKSAQAAIAPDVFQRINAQKQEASVKFLIQQANLRKSELKNNSVQEFVRLLQQINNDRENLRRSGKISQQAGDTPFYVFNVKQHGGFVIVSGDDRTEAILGYSKQGTFDLDNMPDNLRWWLEEYARQLRAIETHQAMPTPRRAQTSTMSAIEPLIKTQWHQSNPYNLMTPISKNSNGEEKHCVTGCVATAFAQVMNYWQWPKECPAIPSYTTSSLNLQLDELPATTFKWDLIQRDYDYSNEVNDNTHAVAELMRYVGQALHMDYTVTESGIAVQPLVLMETFNYSRNLRKILHENFTTAEWEDIIYQDLAAGRPVIYEGYPCDIQKLGHSRHK